MTAIYKPGVIQFVPQYDIGAPHLAANVLYFQSAGSGFTTAQLTAMQTAFNGQWGALWAGLGATQNTFKGTIVTDMSSNTGLQVRNDSFTPLNGAGTGGPLADSTCVLISLKTAVRYRGGHGRIYLPGIAISRINNDGRTLSDSFRTATDTAWNQVVNAMSAISGTNGGPLQPIVWHKHLSSNPNTTENVLQGATQTVLANQRRRLRRVARHRRR